MDVTEKGGNFPMKESSDSNGSTDCQSSFKLRRQRKEHNFSPVESSHWKYEDLKRIGITYADKPVTLQEFMSNVKSGSENRLMGYEKVPPIFKTLAQVTKDVWRFSFNYKETVVVTDEEKLCEVLNRQIGEVEDTIKNLGTQTEAIETQVLGELGNDPQKKK